MLYLCNGFSTGMMGKGADAWGSVNRFEFRTLRPREAGDLLRGNEFVSCFGHPDTAYHLGRYLRVEIPVSRESISLEPDDMLLVASAKHTRAFRERYIGCPRWQFYLIKRMD